MYKFLRPILFQVPEETMHNAVASAGAAFSPLSPLVALPFAFEHPSLETEVFGIKFKNPVGLAPGYDKSGAFASFMAALGFGFIEIGAVTPEPQPGNDKPRLFRRDAEEAIVNRMGFNSIGMMQVAENLRGLRKRDFVLGVNLGKNKSTPNKEAARDYQAGLAALAPLADYVVINVSSPNTPGLCQLLEKEPLLNLLRAMPRTRPLVLKVSPELTDAQLNDIAAVAVELKLSGLIATNTIATPEGGLSGRPLRKRSTEVVAYLYKRLGGQIPIIGAGGIFSAQDAYEKIRAGACLVEIYSGLVYEGPGLVKRIKQGLVEMLKSDGFNSIKE